jgi:hypothetical protein
VARFPLANPWEAALGRVILAAVRRAPRPGGFRQITEASTRRAGGELRRTPDL